MNPSMYAAGSTGVPHFRQIFAAQTSLSGPTLLTLEEHLMKRHLHDAQLRQAAASISDAVEASGISMNGKLSTFEKRRLGELVFEAAEGALNKHAWYRDGNPQLREIHLKRAVQLVPEILLAG